MTHHKLGPFFIMQKRNFFKTLCCNNEYKIVVGKQEIYLGADAA